MKSWLGAAFVGAASEGAKPRGDIGAAAAALPFETFLCACLDLESSSGEDDAARVPAPSATRVSAFELVEAPLEMALEENSAVAKSAGSAA